MTKEVNTHIKFNENCEYQSSSTDIIINVEPQPVNIEITTTNLNTAHTNKGDYNNYYDDIIEVKAHVYQQIDSDRRDIQTGRINFYYKAETSNKKKLLNDNTNSCILTTQGEASIQFKPNQSGTIIAQYIDDKEWYKTTEISDVIVLHPIPVIINFTKKPPYLTDLKNSIELEVEVKKKYPNNENDVINYGVVTFLHYIEHADMNQANKRVEYVIGNPAIVNNGVAKIKYIPVQEYDDLEPTTLIDGTEYIRAVYDYNNDLYFSEENAVYGYETIEPNRNIGHWQYFESANVYTNIEIFKPNSVTIGIRNKSIHVDGRYHYEENNNIVIEAELFDDKGENIVLKQDSVKHLTFHVIGSYITLSKNYLINYDSSDDIVYNSYAKDFSFDSYEYRTDENNKQHGYFIKTISGLKPGNYTIQASTHGQIVNGEILLYDSDEPLIVIEKEIDDEIHQQYDTTEIRNDIYLDSIDISNTLYINSTFKEIDYSIVTRCKKDTIKTQELANNYIESEVTIDNNYKEILNNQRCHFFSPETGDTYIGILTFTNGKLIGKPADEIRFNSGDYSLYMYIPGGYYTDGTNNIFIKTDRKLKEENAIINNQNITYMWYAPNTPANIRVRSDIILNLDYNFISDTTLGSINYTISSDDIHQDQTADVEVILTKNNSIITTHSYILTADINQYENVIDNLQAGDYILTASAASSVSKTFTIKSTMLSQELQTDSKIIRATPNGVVNLVISSSSANLTNLDLNKLHVYACKNVNEFNMNTAVEHSYTTKYVKNDSIYLTIQAGTYVPTKLLFAAYYEGDSNIQEMLCEPEECNTTLISSIIRPLNYTNTTATFVIEPTTRNIVIIGRVKYYNDAILLEERFFITSNTLNIFLQNIPTTCNNIEFIINPYDNDIIQHIINESLPLNTERPLYIFEETDSTPTNISRAILYIKQQYIDSSNQCLFPLFDQQSQKFSRNIR